MTNKTDERSSFMDYPVGKMVIGLIFLGGAFWLYIIFSELQTGARESFRIHWLIAFLYNSLGPTLTLLIMGLLGIIIFGFGFFQYFREKSPDTDLH